MYIKNPTSHHTKNPHNTILAARANVIIWWGSFLNFISLILAFLIKYIKFWIMFEQQKSFANWAHFKVDQAKNMTWQKFLALEKFSGSFEWDFPGAFNFTLNSLFEVCYRRNHHISLHCRSTSKVFAWCLHKERRNCCRKMQKRDNPFTLKKEEKLKGKEST